MKTAEEIASIANERKTHCGDAQSRMDKIRQLYNGEMQVDLPELGENEEPVAANLAQLGIDQMAMRVASVFPAVNFAVERIGESAKERARLKRDVVTHDWWPHSRVLTHVVPRRSRWFFAFATAPVMLRPGYKPGREGLPCWYERHPIGTYPAPVSQVGDLCPPNVVFTFKKGGAELMSDYPEQMMRICGGDMRRLGKTYDVVEYVDAEQITCVVVGSGQPDYMATPGTKQETLHSMPNRTERPLAVIPGRITLDKPLGQFDGLIGAYLYQARMMALYMIAQERAVFPEEWIVSPQQGMPQAKVHVVADPKEGIVGEIEGGTIQKIDMSPNPMSLNLVDRLEYVERTSGAIPAEFSGHSASNVRTGRRGDAVMSAAVDYRLQEAQTIFEASLEEENKIAIAIAKSYAGSTQFSLYVQGRGNVTYSPSKDFADDTHEVRYAYAGADANSLTIAVGQKQGLETISKRTSMELDPMIRDVEFELDQIQGEALERAFLSSIQTQAADPNGPYQPRDMARLIKLVRDNNVSLADAVEKVDEEIRQREAAQAQGQMQGADAMAGLSMPGAPGAPVPPAVQDIGSSVGNLAEMFTQLRRPQMQIASEGQPLAQPAVA